MATSENHPDLDRLGCRLSKRGFVTSNLANLGDGVVGESMSHNSRSTFSAQLFGSINLVTQTRRLLLVIYLYPRIDTLIYMIYMYRYLHISQNDWLSKNS